MVRNLLRLVGWKERKAIVADLRAICTADTIDAAELALTSFCKKCDKAFPAIGKSWLKHWNHITSIFDYSKEICKVIYATNAIESLNGSFRKVIKNKRVFPSDDAA